MDTVAGLFPKRNAFDLTHERKFSCDMGKLIPIALEEVVPGDSFKWQTDMLIRVTPLLSPMMHRVNVFTHFFFVPNRLVWDNFQKFITGGSDGLDATVSPTITVTPTSGTLADYFGLPLAVAESVSALPFRASNLIYNEWYRDQNLQTEIAISKGDGADATTSTTLLTRNWEKDYFTAALPWPQKGAAVTIPLGTSATVTIPPVHPISGSNQLEVGVSQTGNFQYARAAGGATTTVNMDANITAATHLTVGGRIQSDHTLQGTADLSTATAATINAFRQAFQVQKWMERNARAGSRYVESILAHFGVRSSDARLQRPEYLGGGKSNIVVSEVVQTSASSITGSTTAQGTMAGHSFSAMKTHAFKKSFEEHGWIIGIMSIMPRTAYQQGVPRMFTRATKYDYFWPEFQNLGEQAVLQKEIYADGTGNDNNVFGYQARYDEYRQRPSTVHGDFRTTLNFWHMGRIFAGAPALNSTFITSDPTKRMLAVTTGHSVWVQLLNSVTAVRPISKTGEPGFIDHN